MQSVAAFQNKVIAYYRANRRELPWRPPELRLCGGILDPYAILVSEVMLQQTQVSRVVPKYQAFLKRFKTVEVLAAASPREVLKEWSGLGYNRRGLNLHRAAQMVVQNFDGVIPKTYDELRTLPGVGDYTARAVLCFAFNQSSAFIETNIRTVFIHEFFPRRAKVGDDQLVPLIIKTLPTGAVRRRVSPRDWYYALMDYGAHLKTVLPNPSRRSMHHSKQSQFKGSNRELRGKMLRLFLSKKSLTKTQILAQLTSKSSAAVLAELAAEGFVTERLGRYTMH